MKNKKGAIELGMNTIIIVVLGMALLVGGLVWITGVFDIINDLPPEPEFPPLFDQPFAFSQSKVSLSPSDSQRIGAKYRNEDSQAQDITFKLKSVNQGENVNAKCLFTSNFDTETESYNIPSGQEKELDVLVQVSKKSGLGTASCTLVAEGFGLEEVLLISVEA